MYVVDYPWGVINIFGPIDHLVLVKQVCYEFDLIMGQENTFELFLEAWNVVWKKLILDYAASSISKPIRLQHALRDMDLEDDQGNHCYILKL